MSPTGLLNLAGLCPSLTSEPFPAKPDPVGAFGQQGPAQGCVCTLWVTATLPHTLCPWGSQHWHSDGIFWDREQLHPLLGTHREGPLAGRGDPCTPPCGSEHPPCQESLLSYSHENKAASQMEKLPFSGSTALCAHRAACTQHRQKSVPVPRGRDTAGEERGD